MEKSSRLALIIAIVLLFVGGLSYFVSRVPDKATPDDLIRESLHDGQEAARRGDVAGVMSIVSDDFHAGRWNRARLRLLLSRTLGHSQGVAYDVKVNQPRIGPSPLGKPDERLVITQFAAFDPGSGDDYYKTNGPITLIMRAETARKYLFFSEPRWRIVSIVDLSGIPGGDDAGGGLGM